VSREKVISFNIAESSSTRFSIAAWLLRRVVFVLFFRVNIVERLVHITYLVLLAFAFLTRLVQCAA